MLYRGTPLMHAVQLLYSSTITRYDRYATRVGTRDEYKDIVCIRERVKLQNARDKLFKKL
jgi:glutathione synthase/RimK-type ligase-like ATP-grasp enzyme